MGFNSVFKGLNAVLAQKYLSPSCGNEGYHAWSNSSAFVCVYEWFYK